MPNQDHVPPVEIKQHHPTSIIDSADYSQAQLNLEKKILVLLEV